MTREIENIVIHCSATKPNVDIGSREIRSWHLDRGWKDIGYHFVIRRNGKIELGRRLDVPGAHVKGHNATSIGVCYVGGLDEAGRPTDNRTHRQFKSMEILVKVLWALFPDANVVGHNDFQGVTKACPCFDVSEWVEYITSK